jgi:hypothetical protein
MGAVAPGSGGVARVGLTGRGPGEGWPGVCQVGRPLIKCFPTSVDGLPARIVGDDRWLRLGCVSFGWVLRCLFGFLWLAYGVGGWSMAPRVGDRPHWSSRSVTAPVLFCCLGGVCGQLVRDPRMASVFMAVMSGSWVLWPGMRIRAWIPFGSWPLCFGAACT